MRHAFGSWYLVLIFFFLEGKTQTQAQQQLVDTNTDTRIFIL